MEISWFREIDIELDNKPNQLKRYVVIDTSIFLLIREKFDVIEGLKTDLSEHYECATTDSVVREIIRIAIKSRDALMHTYIQKIFEKCYIETLSEDLEGEEADFDILRLAKILGAPILTLDRELKDLAREEEIPLIIYKGSDKRIRLP